MDKYYTTATMLFVIIYIAAEGNKCALQFIIVFNMALEFHFSFICTPVYCIPHASAVGSLTCLCDQFRTPDCVRVNETWGECNTTGGLCVASWERIYRTTIVYTRFICSDDQLLRYRCLPTGVQTSGSTLYPAVTACCASDNCNTQEYLYSQVNATIECQK